MVLLCVTNLVTYIDRGIVPGASGEFNSFIAHSAGGLGGSVSTCFGALASAFIVGFSVGSIAVSHLAHTRPPFKMAAIGLVAWCVAAVVAGLARDRGSYLLLLAARAASGLGEAGFVTIGGPFIQDAAKGHPGRWLGVYYAAIPTGTAIGYGYGASVASALNWSACFYIEAVAMVPLALLFYLSNNDGSSVVRDQPADISGETLFVRIEELERADDSGDAREGGRSLNVSDDHSSLDGGIGAHQAPTLAAELRACAASPTFIWAALGYAGYAGAVVGFSTFGPAIAVGLGLWTDMTGAAISFSGTMAASGIIGTPLGGYLLDWWTARRRAFPGNSDLSSALEVSLLLVSAGAALLSFSAFATRRAVFLLSLGCGTLPLFAATSSMSLALFESVPRSHRAFGQALGTLIMHGLGDVPTPVIVGGLKDKLAPACTPSSRGALGDDCPSQRRNLRAVTLACDLWLGFSLLGFALALAAARNRNKGYATHLHRDDDTAPLARGDASIVSPLAPDLG